MMTGINGFSPNGYASVPPKMPSYKEDQISGLRVQEGSYESKIAQLKSGNDEENAAVLQETESKLASVQEQLEELKPVTPIKPWQNIAPPPPTDEEMNARFGAAYAVELSSVGRQMDSE